MSEDLQPLLLTAKQVAALLNVTARFCYELAANGTLPSVRLGKRVLFPRAAVYEFAQAPQSPGDIE